VNQAKWCQPDYTPKGCSWTIALDPEAEYDEADFEDDEPDRGEGPEDSGIGDIDGLEEQLGRVE
jgi:hypothetical protein